MSKGMSAVTSAEMNAGREAEMTAGTTGKKNAGLIEVKVVGMVAVMKVGLPSRLIAKKSAQTTMQRSTLHQAPLHRKLTRQGKQLHRQIHM
jgi:hypothetical protein